ncbi:putative hydrolase of the HAD superfamily [Fontibacillus panacisegetis]|uniref:Putative hydrolase of the HAD superfamily n=1 Tax=Fontibacillus panacisegetis TaxID=670482 RepID=A0A1G7EQQ4_9BACL|nr:HAD family hydrolase [Fontibacillus panacisegetis]SDE65959.1 putative hydrolase of the HAD superfamily [Fontibacillus panacisegetis]
MKHFEVVSLDMFQTLVNVDSRIEQIWKPILSNIYTQEVANECAQLLLSYFLEYWAQMKNTQQFFLMKEVYERSFVSVFEHLNLSYDSIAANKSLFEEHTLSEFYEDTLEFLNRISEEYKICIVSDADDAMIPSFYTNYGIRMFTSEQFQSYKNDENNIMFKEMLKFFNTDPGKVLHIGDSVSDIVGANREGITTCWLNRNKRTWEHQVKPDYVIESLNDLEGIL